MSHGDHWLVPPGWSRTLSRDHGTACGQATPASEPRTILSGHVRRSIAAARGHRRPFERLPGLQLHDIAYKSCRIGMCPKCLGAAARHVSPISMPSCCRGRRLHVVFTAPSMIAIHRLSDRRSGLRPSVSRRQSEAVLTDRGHPAAPCARNRHHPPCSTPGAYLTHQPPACPIIVPGGRHRLGDGNLWLSWPSPLLAAVPRAHQAVPGDDACESPRRSQTRPAGSILRPMSPRPDRRRRPFAAYLAPLRESIGTSIQSPPVSAYPTRCSPICRAPPHRVVAISNRPSDHVQRDASPSVQDYYSYGRARYTRITPPPMSSTPPLPDARPVPKCPPPQAANYGLSPDRRGGGGGGEGGLGWGSRVLVP